MLVVAWKLPGKVSTVVIPKTSDEGKGDLFKLLGLGHTSDTVK